MNDVVTHLITFVAGAATGAAGKYFGDKYTDARHRSEKRRQEKAIFAKMVALMPDLLDEMKVDISVPEHALWREFFVIPNGACMLGMENTFYYQDDGKNAFLNKARILEEHGYVIDITPRDAPMFRMREHFVENLRKWESKTTH